MDLQGRLQPSVVSTEFEKPRDHPSEDGKNVAGDRSLYLGQGAGGVSGLQEVTRTSL